MAKRGLSESEVLALRPVRLAEWSESGPEEASKGEAPNRVEEASGPNEDSASDAAPGGAARGAGTGPASRVMIERPMPPVRGLRSLLARISALTGAKRLRLDERGSFLWRRIDGDRTAEELAEALREAFGEAVEPAGERVARFLYNLDREQLIELRDTTGAQVKLGHL